MIRKFTYNQSFKMHVKPKEASPLGYYGPGLVLGLLVVTVFVYFIYLPILYLLLICGGYFLVKRYFVPLQHPLGLTQEEIHQSKNLFVCIVGAGFSGLADVVKC